MAQHMKHQKTSLESTDDSSEDDDRQQTQIYAKDSMDRFGDDLCQLLLSNLSLKNRFVFQCMSKQFRRTVFRSVVDIDVRDELIKGNYNTMTPIIATMNKVIKKCQNIETIDFRGLEDSNQYILEVLPEIRHKIPKLREIYCDLMSNSERWVRQLAPLVTRVGNHLSSQKESLIHCNRLSELRVENLAEVFDTTSGQLLAKNLRSFWLKGSANSEQLSAFLAGNQCLRFLLIKIHNLESLTQFGHQLSQLPQLRVLVIRLRHFDQSLNDSLRTIGVNCKQLTILALKLGTKTTEINVQTLDSLEMFGRLRQLELALIGSNTQSFDLLIPGKRLINLMIQCSQIDCKLLGNCHKQWPRLQYLDFECQEFNDKCLDHILRLRTLQTLVIQCDHNIDLLDNDFCDLLATNPNLKNIEINANNEKKFYCR
ncbi:unnamed protein product [Medioppia subpectinata]|uniref:Uncharacterized protein n=1 Tax=Medioppia subpectinata TaxID=1979941 RepID=A0A7R9Q5R4_9ACAR|nr:unnamed protein product [Medioppia subpectinata]CAG2114015.1 unnamed protein product [Medioppia subpectinata]